MAWDEDFDSYDTARPVDRAGQVIPLTMTLRDNYRTVQIVILKPIKLERGKSHV